MSSSLHDSHPGCWLLLLLLAGSYTGVPVVAAAVGVFGCLGLRGQSICLDAWPVQQVPLELPHLPPAVASGSRPHREIRNPQHDVLALPPRVPPGNDLVAIGTRFPFSDSATAAAAKVAAAAF